jgi:hypothetical protein
MVVIFLFLEGRAQWVGEAPAIIPRTHIIEKATPMIWFCHGRISLGGGFSIRKGSKLNPSNDRRREMTAKLDLRLGVVIVE